MLDRSHPLVRAARDGDRVVLWARALYPVGSPTGCTDHRDGRIKSRRLR